MCIRDRSHGAAEEIYGPTLQELSLTYNGGTIAFTNVEKIVDKQLVDTRTLEGRGDLEGLFDGDTTYDSSKRLQWKTEEWNSTAPTIILYIELDSKLDITGGSYYTYEGWLTTNINSHAIIQANIYGTNTDPKTFADKKDLSNWNYVCNLTTLRAGF